MAKVILCITEGEKAEVEVIRELKKHFIIEDTVQIISFSAEIYQFYRHIKDENDEFLDTFAVLQQRCPDDATLAQYTRDQISEIYLFFDYDGHATKADDKHIMDMLEFFDNETEEGKLYISYPMVEAFKESLHEEVLISDVIRLKTTLVSLGKAYKAAVNQRCDHEFRQASKRDKDKWRVQLTLHLKTGHYIVKNEYSFPNYDVLMADLTQVNIFSHQKEKHIDPNQSVAILSPFVFFILEYRGRPLLEEWQTLFHQ